MRRRSFLKGLLAAAVVPAVAVKREIDRSRYAEYAEKRINGSMYKTAVIKL